MSNNVFANGNAVACEAGDDKVIAAFPDVCLSPPSPPAGPIPVPYPDSSFSKDMKSGSKAVKINGKPVMLKDKSYYKSSPLGDEAATRSFGANVVTHGITGKTFFNAWSMDVKIEGANADRHLDLATSNHSSYPPGSGPGTAMEQMAVARMDAGKCPCCGKEAHVLKRSVVDKKEQAKERKAAAKGKTHTRVRRRRNWFKKRGSGRTRMNMNEWYQQNIAAKFPPATAATKQTEFNQLMADVAARTPCSCPTPKPPLLPQAPCDVFFGPTPDPAMKLAVEDSWDSHRPAYQAAKGIKTAAATEADMIAAAPLGSPPPTQQQIQDERQVNHLTPKSAGGCPTGDGNLQPNKDLCADCKKLDKRFSDFQ